MYIDVFTAILVTAWTVVFYDMKLRRKFHSKWDEKIQIPCNSYNRFMFNVNDSFNVVNDAGETEIKFRLEFIIAAVAAINWLRVILNLKLTP